jgi:hypothetical protein
MSPNPNPHMHYLKCSHRRGKYKMNKKLSLGFAKQSGLLQSDCFAKPNDMQSLKLAHIPPNPPDLYRPGSKA